MPLCVTLKTREETKDGLYVKVNCPLPAACVIFHIYILYIQMGLLECPFLKSYLYVPAGTELGIRVRGWFYYWLYATILTWGSAS